ncbi:hypothetical protein A3H53_04570 [Candidatus Nomurabacteria bacterium RIFCSPLOWO2_02_FULL_40_10]|uniref:PPC domain-containing protein n=2 Tax=Candidatus Nomuraibacteriota TaxID=1752729 RepID=A0A1F6XV40_9BACT|nr:MAG: hypothetical protein A2642_03210 [Candidatus Nomurabacteria bacterium RIFCSPHIGHO2_01_FULL_39_10]OGI97977.1 MAG: hypothetical protein A3H53_04570 [Candidatus Nomurabacteria bacterium RIFCSPLOWO2_02_FULL_40_10]
MQIILDSQNKSVVRIEKGEEFLSVLKSVAQKKDLSCNFSMIGACREVELSYFDVATKKYFKKVFNMGNIEMVSVNGNVTWFEGEPMIHAHGVFSDEEYKCFGGHIAKLIISITGEVVIDWLPSKINKKVDKETGLKFLSA